jgi:hypothetical protein
VPTLPLGSSVVVIFGGAVIVIDNTFVALPAALVALTVKLEVPCAVGVPDITPAVDRLSPVGSVPLCNDHVIGVEPVADSVVL